MRNLLAVLIVMFSLSVMSANTLEGVSTAQVNGEFVATYKFSSPVDPQTVTLDVQDKSAQIIIPNGQMPTDKNLVRVEDSGIKSVYTTQEPQGLIRSKVAFESSFQTADMKDSIRIAAEGNNIKVYIRNLSEEAVAPQSLDSQQIVESVAVGEEKTSVISAVKNTEQAPLKESEIPVLAAAKVKKVESKSSFPRVFMSLLIIGLLAAGLIFFSKWYAKNNKKNVENTRIRVLTQHFLGPRKSLAIVRVAGETILIGVTDQNISMIKSLSLIDDEFPEVMPGSFEKSLKTADARVAPSPSNTSAEEDAEDFIISSIKDKVSAKINSMRNI